MSLVPFFAIFAFGTWWLGAPPDMARKRMIPGISVTVALLVTTVFALPHPAMLDKLLIRLAMPVGLIWLLLYGLIPMALRAGRRRRAALAAAIWLLFTLAGSPWLGGALFAQLERGVPPLSAVDHQSLDVIMVLGGGTEPGPDGRAQLTSNGDRLRVAALAFRRGMAPKLLASGTSIAGLDQAGSRDLGAEARTVLHDMGVAGDVLLTLPGPHNTATEVAALAERARAEGWTRIGIVTSAWHMPRALRLARGRGLDPVPIGADFRGRIPPPSAVGLVPTGSGHYRVQVAFKEYLARLVGR